MLAITFDTWEEVNVYFEQGWQYIDSKVVEVKGKGNKVNYCFILGKKGEDNPVSVIIKRSRHNN